MRAAPTLAGMLQSALSAGATLVAVAFALTTYERWRDRRRAHELAWAAALAIFAVASTCLWFGASSGWNRALFRGFFAAGAVVDVPILALGTVYLLWGRRRGDQAAAVVALFSAFA